MGSGSSQSKKKEKDVDVFLDTESEDANASSKVQGVIDNASGHQPTTQRTDPDPAGTETVQQQTTGLRAGAQSVDGGEGQRGEGHINFPNKPKLSVPSHLYFSAREEKSVEELVLENEEEEDPVFFKVKTTHPQLFTVKPVTGKLDPAGHLSVRVNYSPPDDLVSLEKLGKLKLMVQGLKVDFPRDILPQAVWTAAPKKSLFVKVIKVDFSENDMEEDLTKFMSVQMPASSTSSSKLWWK